MRIKLNQENISFGWIQKSAEPNAKLWIRQGNACYIHVVNLCYETESASVGENDGENDGENENAFKIDRKLPSCRSVYVVEPNFFQFSFASVKISNSVSLQNKCTNLTGEVAMFRLGNRKQKFGSAT